MPEDEPSRELVPVEPPHSLDPLPPTAGLSAAANQNQGLLILFALLSSNMFALVVALISEFLSLRGVVDVAASRFALIGAWVAGMFIVGCFVWGKGIRAKKSTMGAGAILLTGLLWGLDVWAPKPTITVEPARLIFDESLPRENFSLRVHNKTDFYAYSVQIKMKLSQRSSAEFSFDVPSPKPIMEGSKLMDVQGLRCVDRNQHAVVMFWIYGMDSGSTREISVTHNGKSDVAIDSSVVYFTGKAIPRRGDITQATGTFHFDEPLTCNGDITFQIAAPVTVSPTPKPSEPLRPHLSLRTGETYLNSVTHAWGVNIYIRPEKYGSYDAIETEMKAATEVRDFSESTEAILEDDLFAQMLRDAPFARIGKIPPDREEYHTLTSRPQPDDFVIDVKQGKKVVHFMAEFRYRQVGTKKWFHSDICGFLAGDPIAVRLCHEHNVEP